MSNAFIMRPLEIAAITASATATGYDAAFVSPYPVPRMGNVWRATSGSSASLTIDLGADEPLDTIALFGIGNGNFSPVTSWNWTVELATAAQGSFTGAHWDGSSAQLLAGSVIPVSGVGKALWLAPAGAPASARYVRLSFTNLGAALLQIALVTIGKRFQPERNYSYGAAFGARDLGRLDYSPRGAVLHRAGKVLRGVGLTLRSLRREEVEDDLQRLFERVGNTSPAVIVTDADAHAQRQSRMYCGHLTGNLGSVHRVPGFFQAELNLVAVD